MAIRAKKYVPKERVFTGVRFDGTNSKEVAAWINKQAALIPSTVSARARGFLIELENEDGDKRIVRKGEYVTFDDIGWLMWSEAELQNWLQPKKPAISEAKALATLNS